MWDGLRSPYLYISVTKEVLDPGEVVHDEVVLLLADVLIDGGGQLEQELVSCKQQQRVACSVRVLLTRQDLREQRVRQHHGLCTCHKQFYRSALSRNSHDHRYGWYPFKTLVS